MKPVRFVLPFILGLLLLPHSANAAVVRVEQLWWGFSPLFGGVFDPTVTVDTLGIFDDAGISGVGVEAVALTHFSMAVYKNGIGQNFNVADFPVPPSLTQEGNIAAVFNNGVFNGLSGVNLGGAARIAIRDGNTGGFAGGINIAGNELIWSFPASGTAEYRLQSTDLVFPNASVTLPGAVWLFLSALPFAVGLAWRKGTVKGAMNVA